MANEISEGVFSNNGNWFVKSSYWGAWDRSLLRMGGRKYPHAIEVTMTPINHVDFINDFGSNDLARIMDVRIREHATTEKPQNFTHRLSHNVADRIKFLVGEYFFNILVHEDLLSKIDQVKMKHFDNTTNWPWGGGVPFILLAKEPLEYKPLLDHWFRVIQNEPHYQQALDSELQFLFNLWLEDNPVVVKPVILKDRVVDGNVLSYDEYLEKKEREFENGDA